MTEDTAIKPWFRQPWFWFLLIFPGASIIWCTIAITVALNTDNAMVTDDYSKEGRAINLELARDQKAADMNLNAIMEFSGDRLSVNLNSKEGYSDYPYLVLNLFHPTLSEKDRTVQLQSMGGGYYRASLPRNLDGRWYMDLRGPSNEWRLKGELFLPSETPLTLDANASAG
ncbi:MAG: FixH family protein [Marinobacter sp.]|uniref:FixH family protein n=1 Tax=Marinobacter sp. TaxID=50741 RepID=UPI00299F237A|nr:FixH family protein [Marinobacter sp.]MDX1635717.1 FixH family protein [Marinobacter sp.]